MGSKFWKASFSDTGQLCPNIRTSYVFTFGLILFTSNRYATDLPGISDFLESPLKHRFCFWDANCIHHTLSSLSGFPRKSRWKSPLLFQSVIMHGFIASITCMMPVSPASWISFRSEDKGCSFLSMSLIQSGEMPFYATLARLSSSKKKKKTFKHIFFFVSYPW